MNEDRTGKSKSLKCKLKEFIDRLEDNMDSGAEMTGWDVCHLLRNQFKLDIKKAKTLMEVFAEEEKKNIEPQKGFDPTPIEKLIGKPMKKIQNPVNPKLGPSRKWSRIMRASGLIEWVCEHGCGHPDEYSAEQLDIKNGHKSGTWSVHGCDGCCHNSNFPGRTKKCIKS